MAVTVTQTTGAWELPVTAKCSYGSKYCTGTGIHRLDPYDSDVNNRNVFRYLCDPCTDVIADEI